MCGIAGFVESAEFRDGSVLGPDDRLSAVLKTIKHRGPDDWGMTFFGYPQESLTKTGNHVKLESSVGIRLALGHQRLAILDLSQAGRQPMMSRDGKYWITFNGEIYNYLELRKDLSKAAEFRTGTDTEVLLEAYRQWGTKMLEKLDGMFAFALWDAAERRLLCARDPMGIKPFYYALRPGQFLFASEPKAVLAGLALSGHMDPVHIAEFLVLGVSDHDEGTSYQEVRQVRGGHWIQVDTSASISEPQPFWHPPNEVVEQEVDVPHRVREQIELAVCRQLRSDVPVGGCLSGGLDSGSLVATVGEVKGRGAGEFKALTLVSKNFEADESGLASLTAQRAGVSWVKVEPSLNSMATEIEEMVKAMDEPFISLSMFAQRKIMRRAQELGIKVMLDGQGGDEVFLGYPRIAQRILTEHFRNGKIFSALGEWQALKQHASHSLTRLLLGNIYFGWPRMVRWRSQMRIKSLVEPSLLSQVRSKTACQMYGAGQKVYGLQLGELTRFCLPQLLRFEDRNSMAYGVEARVPLLSNALVDLGLRLPWAWKVRKGWTKYALRMAMTDHLPHEIVWGRHKRGFEVPQRRWVESSRIRITQWLRELPKECPLNVPRILAAIDEGHSGEEWFWRCLSVALWIRFSGVRT